VFGLQTAHLAAACALLAIPLTWRWKLQTGAGLDLTPQCIGRCRSSRTSSSRIKADDRPSGPESQQSARMHRSLTRPVVSDRYRPEPKHRSRTSKKSEKVRGWPMTAPARKRTLPALAGLAVSVATLCPAVRTASTTPAEAKGCLKGAIVGGAAGHYAAHHGVLGAAAGCLIGRHEANAKQKQQQQNQAQDTRDHRSGAPQ
jgi:hypothetical protein